MGEQLAARRAEDPVQLDHSAAVGTARRDEVGLENGLANEGESMLGGEGRRPDDPNDDHGQREEQRRSEDDEGRRAVGRREVRRPATHVHERPQRDSQPDEDDVSLDQVSGKADGRVRQESADRIADRRPDAAHRAPTTGRVMEVALRVMCKLTGAIMFLRGGGKPETPAA